MDYLLLSRPLYLQERECGYCHGEKSVEEATTIKSWIPYNDTFEESKTIGFDVGSITIDQYLKLMDLNYRRSGTFLYKCDNLRNCCFYHTIRTNFTYLKMNKELKNDLNKFNTVIGMGGNKAKNGFDVGLELGKMLKSDKFRIEFEEKEDHFDEKFELFQSYQESVHDDEVNKVSFKRFLIDSPFKQDGKIEKFLDANNELQYRVLQLGPAQVCYYYEDKLIAISFLDVLPTGISSIYFIYDHNFSQKWKLSMGKISILFELLLMQKLGLEYLYLGYYIKDCIKMKYKAKFGGEILNPINFNWETFNDETLARFDTELESKFGFGNLNLKEWELLSTNGLDYDKSLNLFKYDDEKFNHVYELPITLINSSPIEEILAIRDNITVKLLFNEQLLEVPFNDLTTLFQKIVLNTIRMVGLQLFKEVVLRV